MAFLPETADWTSVTQIETTEPVIGGPDGVSNRALKQLTRRTAFLKALAEALGVDVATLQTEVAALETATTPPQLLELIKTVDGTGSGLDADKVRGMNANFSSVKFAQGYQVMPSGVIFQWGSASTSTGSEPGVVTVVFPTAFPTVLDCLVLSDRADGTGGISGVEHLLWAGGANATNFQAVATTLDTVARRNTVFSFFAIGH